MNDDETSPDRQVASGDGRDPLEVVDRELFAARGRAHTGLLQDGRGGRRRAAEHVRQGLPQHLAALPEGRIHDREGAQALPFGTGQKTWRDTVPASRHGPYQAALALGAP